MATKASARRRWRRLRDRAGAAERDLKLERNHDCSMLEPTWTEQLHKIQQEERSAEKEWLISLWEPSDSGVYHLSDDVRRRFYDAFVL